MYLSPIPVCISPIPVCLSPIPVYVSLISFSGVKPFASVNYARVYPVFAAAVWAVVMWLYECHPDVLQPSLTA